MAAHRGRANMLRAHVRVTAIASIHATAHRRVVRVLLLTPASFPSHGRLLLGVRLRALALRARGGDVLARAVLLDLQGFKLGKGRSVLILVVASVALKTNVKKTLSPIQK